MGSKEYGHEDSRTGDWVMYLATVRSLVNNLETLAIEARGNGASAEELCDGLRALAAQFDCQIVASAKARSRAAEGEEDRLDHCSYSGWKHCKDGTCRIVCPNRPSPCPE